MEHALADALKEIIEYFGDGFHRSGSSDSTSWDVCADCYRADWEGHSKDCRIAACIKKAKQALGKYLGEEDE